MADFQEPLRHFDDCDCRMCRKHWFKEQSLRNRQQRAKELKRRFHKGWKDSYQDSAGSWLDRSVMGMFLIGGIATAIGLI